jgi:sec-independent protein translocase protein TatC
MSFWEHLDELRATLIQCLYIFFASFLGLYFVSDKILDFLRAPLFRHLPTERRHLYYTGLFENFLVHLKVSAYAALILMSPIYFMILWRFISPGLKSEEKKNILPFVFASSLFFLMGSGFAYYVLFPIGVKYFLQYGTDAEVAWLTLDNYVSVVMRILIGFGLCFQFPVVIVMLAKLGLISYESLAQKRRVAIIVVTVISALVAPPDAISMLMLMAPLYLLFELALVFVKVKFKSNKS